MSEVVGDLRISRDPYEARGNCHVAIVGTRQKATASSSKRADESLLIYNICR